MLRDSLASILTVLLSVVLLGLQCHGRKTECYVDEAGDKMDPNNIYRCDLDQSCCREKGLPSCCNTKDTNVAMMEQIKLWGILVSFILVLALLMWFCRHDGDCCCNAKDGRHSCCGKAYGKKPQDKYAKDSDMETDSDDDDDDDDKKKKKQKAKEAENSALKSAKRGPKGEDKDDNAHPTSARHNLKRNSVDIPPCYSNLELNNIA